MSFAGVLGLFRARPSQPVSADGRMALADHLRELRARLLRSVAVLVAATVLAFFFYRELFELILGPYNQARTMLDQDVVSKPVINGVTDPLMIQIKICALAAVIATCPYWLYQLWAFIVPGLHPHERRWTRLFAVVAGPLFVVGVAVGYYVLPKGLQVLIGFTPVDLENLVPFTGYFSFFTRMLLVFGVAFEIPLFVVLLNLAGIVSGRALAAHRPWIVLGTFVFAAIATPSTDPFSMLMLAVPMTLLFMISEVVARLVDKRRRRKDVFAGLDDDAQSDIGGPSDIDGPTGYRRSSLDEDDD
jgi:sec-independent protein translocase protein TatC